MLMRLRGAVFALLFVVIIMVSLVLVVFGDSIHLWLVKYIPFVAVFTRIILSFRLFLMLAILTVFFAALYKVIFAFCFPLLTVRLSVPFTLES